jgi:hypothetical protein
MTGKFSALAATLLVFVAATGCHQVRPGAGLFGKGYLQGDGCCQKGPVQKGVCQEGCGGCDGGYRGNELLGALHSYFWCSGGCGEVYLGEWLYDPPDCCDPCDDCYGMYVGPRDCCKRKWIIDPALWILALKHKHCRTDGWYDPCGNWHCYGDGGCCGGCGKGGCAYGGDIFEGEFIENPMPETASPDYSIEDIPDPTPVPAVRTGRVASGESAARARPASHELRR